MIRAALAALVLVLAGCASSAVSPSEPVPSAAPPREISREEAIEQARAALSERSGGDWVVVSATTGTLQEADPDWGRFEWAQGLSGDLRVWAVGMRKGNLSAAVYIDPVDGSVYGTSVGIAN